MNPFKALASHRFTQQLARILLYLGLSRLISIAGTAWAVRCLGPENNGISGQILNLMGVLVLFVNCSLDTLFIRHYKNASTDEQRKEWIAMALSQRFFFSLIIGIVAIPLACLFLRITHPPGHWWLGIFAALPLFIVTCMQPTWVAIAQEDVPVNFRAAAISSVFAAIAYLVFFRHGQAAGSDLVVLTAQLTLQFFILGRVVFKPLWPLPIRWSLVGAFRPIFAEGRWLFVSGLVIYIYTTLEVPMLTWLCSLSEQGKYSVATKLVNSAQQVLGLAPMLLFPRFVEWRKQGPAYLWRRQLRLAGFVIIAGAPVCTLVFLLSPMLFRLLYGSTFASAAIPFAILFTSKFVVILNGLFGLGLWAQAEDRKVFWIMVPTAAISFMLNLLLLPHYGMLGACSVNLLSEIFVLIGCFVLARRHMKATIAQAPPSEPSLLP